MLIRYRSVQANEDHPEQMEHLALKAIQVNKDHPGQTGLLDPKDHKDHLA
jgi:hypothetical protein